jgi:polysaccharide biosynthesis protein PslH
VARANSVAAAKPEASNAQVWRVGRAQRVASMVGAVARGIPLQARYDWQPVTARALADLVQRGSFDVAHVEHLRGAIYGEVLLGMLPVVWDSVDCITDLFEQAAQCSASRRGRWMARFELGRTRRHEAHLVRTFHQTVVTSERDRAALLALADPKAEAPGTAGPGGMDVTVVPNGVDLAYFRPHDSRRDADTILFSGKMGYHANVTAARWLVEDIMPLIWAARPAARVVLAGAEPAQEVRSLAAQYGDRVTVTGYLDDLRPLMHQAAVAVAPIVYGVGVQNKVLEAMACATPVVASLPAVRALAARAGTDVLVAENADTFARMVLDLLADPPSAAALGTAGRAYVERHHDWDASVALLEQAYARAIDRFSMARPDDAGR